MALIKPVLQNTSGVKAEKIGGIIAQVLGEDFGKNAYSRDGDKLDIEDRKNLMIGVLLKLDTPSLNRLVNESRQNRGLPEIKIDKRDVYDFRKGYAELIDQAYVAVATYIGDIHPYADKVHRIGLYNDIIESLEDVPRTLVLSGDETTLKKANLLLKALAAMNAEMGDKTLLDFLRPRAKKVQIEDDEGKSRELGAKEIQSVIEERWGSQLPAPRTARISYTDYTGCANGERLDGKYVCWNDIMCDGKPGSPCAVFEGKLQKCPKFLNRALLDNQEFIKKLRAETSITYKGLARLLGCEEIDNDIRERLKYYLAKHGINAAIQSFENDKSED